MEEAKKELEMLANALAHLEAETAYVTALHTQAVQEIDALVAKINALISDLEKRRTYYKRHAAVAGAFQYYATTTAAIDAAKNSLAEKLYEKAGFENALSVLSRQTSAVHARIARLKAAAGEEEWQEWQEWQE